jgi:hypothetical protein
MKSWILNNWDWWIYKRAFNSSGTSAARYALAITKPCNAGATTPYGQKQMPA